MSGAYEYDAYRGGGFPLVRIGRRVHGVTLRVAEYRLDWWWDQPVCITLDDDVTVTVTPFTPDTLRHASQRPAYGLVAWGRCSAHVRRWGATSPLDMMSERVVAALRRAEEMEALRWMVLSDGERE